MNKLQEVYYLEEALEVLRHETVQELKIKIYNFIGADIAEALKHNTTLTTLDLEANNIGYEGAQYIADLLNHNTTLTTLNLHNNEIGVEDEIGVEGSKHIADALKQNKTLTALNLGNNFIYGKGAKYIADALKQNTTLKALNLYYNQIGDEGAEHFADALKQNKTLAILDLTGNQISAHGATQLADAVNDNASLTTLDLRDSWFGAEDIIVHDKVSSVLKCDTTFEILDLTDYNIGEKAVKHIADMLKHNKTLTTLDLTYNQIGAEGAKHIVEALKYNKTLTTLYLRENYIGTSGAMCIADALKHNTTLTTIDLSCNCIYDQGVKHIADALKHNTTLTTLNLESNEIGDGGAKHIAEALKQNTTLTTLNLWNTLMGDEGVKHVNDAINESMAARRRLFQWPKPSLNRKSKHPSSEDPAHLTKSKSIAIECCVCLEQKGQLHLLPCLHSVCEQCIHDITAISPCVCRECQEPFSSTFLRSNVVGGSQIAIHCPQHAANNATTFCSDCNVPVCIACEHDASHHLDELDEAIKKIQIDLPPILDDLLMQLDQVDEAIEYIVFARLSALNKLASIKSAIQLSFEALNNNQELASQRDALLEQAQAIADHQDKTLDLQSEDLKAAKGAREVALQQVRALVIGGIDDLQKYSVIRSRTNLLLKNLPELEPLVFDVLRFEQVDSQQVGRVFEYEPTLQVSCHAVL